MNPKLSSMLVPGGGIGGLVVVAVGTMIESDFIRELGAFLLLFSVFTFPTFFQRRAESHGG
jgi:hypothetical protein